MLCQGLELGREESLAREGAGRGRQGGGQRSSSVGVQAYDAVTPSRDAPFAFEDILSSRSPRSPVPSDWGAAFPSDFAFWRRIAALTVFRERRSFLRKVCQA